MNDLGHATVPGSWQGIRELSPAPAVPRQDPRQYPPRLQRPSQDRHLLHRLILYSTTDRDITCLLSCSQ
jgi:hypothetical protein